MKILFFDTETTDINPGQIAQLSYIIINTETKESFGKNYYFKVDKMSDGAFNTHGLSIEKLKELSEGKTFKDNVDSIYNDFNSVDIIIGHNVPFDIKFINFEFLNCGLKGINKPSYCTMRHYTGICKIPNSRSYKNYKWPTLDETVQFLKISKENIEKEAIKFFGEFSGYHDSRFDIAGTYLITYIGLKRGFFPKHFFTIGFKSNI